MSSKKKHEVEEQAMLDITDEQLEQVTGGSLTNDGLGVLGTLTGTATGLLNNVSISGVQVEVAGAGVYTPALSTNGLISGLL